MKLEFFINKYLTSEFSDVVTLTSITLDHFKEIIYAFNKISKNFLNGDDEKIN